MANTMTSALESFSEGALCQWLNQPGSATAVGVLAGSAIAVPDPVTTAAGLGLLAMQLGCSFVNPDPNPSGPVQEGCQGRATPTIIEFFNPDYDGGVGAWLTPFSVSDPNVDMSDVSQINGITGYTEEVINNTTYYFVSVNLTFGDGSQKNVTQANSSDYKITQLRLYDNGSACTKEPDPDPGPAPDPDLEPITGYSEELNCTITAELKNWIQSPSGNILPVIQFSSEGGQLLTSGGVIGGCNWYGDLIYVGGEGCQCPTVAPLPPGPPPPPVPPEIPDWLQDILSGLAGEFLKDAIDAIFEQPVPGITYTMVAPCNKDPEGNPEIWEKEIPTVPWLDALGLRIKALNEQISQQLAWKTPICPPDRPELLGDWVTVRFESTEISPQGTRPLRKLFRYRSQSALDLGQKASYWENFSWNAGAVCVQHKGAWWGTPQCWAQNADEGKRVIRFAGLEAGIDPDQLGEWVISGSSDPRFGMPGTMQVAKVEGLEWITSRQGPSGLPVLTVDP